MISTHGGNSTLTSLAPIRTVSVYVLVCSNCHDRLTRKQQLERAKKKQKKSQRQSNNLIGDLKIPKIDLGF